MLGLLFIAIVIMYTKGFTLVEMIVVIGLISLLATAVLVSVNPARQFRFAHDAQRKAHLATLLTAVSQNSIEHQGVFSCGDVPEALPTSKSLITSMNATSSYNLARCLVPNYLAQLPYDPMNASQYFYTSTSSYNTGYYIFQDADGRVTVSARSEIEPFKDIVLTK